MAYAFVSFETKAAPAERAGAADFAVSVDFTDFFVTSFFLADCSWTFFSSKRFFDAARFCLLMAGAAVEVRAVLDPLELALGLCSIFFLQQPF